MHADSLLMLRSISQQRRHKISLSMHIWLASIYGVVLNSVAPLLPFSGGRSVRH